VLAEVDQLVSRADNPRERATALEGATDGSRAAGLDSRAHFVTVEQVVRPALGWRPPQILGHASPLLLSDEIDERFEILDQFFP
jgi:hypothetical protein